MTYLSKILKPFGIHFLRHIIDELINERLGLFHCFAIKQIFLNQKTIELHNKISPMLENEEGDGGRLVPLLLQTKSPNGGAKGW